MRAKNHTFSCTTYMSCTCTSCVHVHFEHRSLIRFPCITGYFWAEGTCAVKSGLTVHVRWHIHVHVSGNNSKRKCPSLHYTCIYLQPAHMCTEHIAVVTVKQPRELFHKLHGYVGGRLEDVHQLAVYHIVKRQ